jgi:hypothetical protein
VQEMRWVKKAFNWKKRSYSCKGFVSESYARN